MTTLSDKILDDFETAFQKTDFFEIENIRSAFALLPHPDSFKTPSAQLCIRLLGLMDQLLEYNPPQLIEMAYNYTNKEWINACAIGQIDGLLKGGENWRRKKLHELPLSEKEILNALPNWKVIKEFDLINLQQSYWKGLTNKSKSLENVYSALLQKAESEEKILKGTSKATYNAYNMMQKFKKLGDWPDAEITPTIYNNEVLPLLDDKHEINRNLGGWALGEIYALANEKEIADMGLPTHTKVFTLVSQKHKQNGNIAATFVHIMRLEVENLDTFDDYPFEDSFDWREWVLDLVLSDTDDNTIIGQPLWFPIHEFFDNDLDAVMRMIDHGKYFTAKMTAEESWLPHMKQAVIRLANLDNTSVAEEARYSLENHWPK